MEVESTSKMRRSADMQRKRAPRLSRKRPLHQVGTALPDKGNEERWVRLTW